MEGLPIGNWGCFLVHRLSLIITGTNAMFSLLGFWVKRAVLPGDTKAPGTVT